MQISKPVPGHPAEYNTSQIHPDWWPKHPTKTLNEVIHTTATPPRQSGPTGSDPTIFYWCLICDRCLPTPKSPFCQAHRIEVRKARRNAEYAAATPTLKVERTVLEELKRLTDHMADQRLRTQVAGRKEAALRRSTPTSAEDAATYEEAKTTYAHLRNELNEAIDNLTLYIRDSVLPEHMR